MWFLSPYLSRTTYISVNVSNQGNLQFVSSSAATGSCVPTSPANYLIAPYWGSLSTNVSPSMDVYTTVTNTAPIRIFVIEWRVQRNGNTSLGITNIEVLLYAGIPKFDFIYGKINDQGLNESIGAQESTGETARTALT